MNFKRLLVLAIASSAAATGQADILVVRNGDVIQGQVLQTNGSSVLFKGDYDTVTYPRSMIKRVQIDSPLTNEVSSSAHTNVLPPWGKVIANLAKMPWAHDLRQIPATVIDKGVLRHVPYLSFRCGVDYEVNIYGDPDNPAGVEIGVYRSLLQDDEAKSNCLDFLRSALPHEQDKSNISRLAARQGIITNGEVSYEITLPTQDDSYNGWWVSVYKIKSLDSARASDAELEQIAVTKAAAAEQNIWTGQQITNARTNSDFTSSAIDAADPGPSYGGRVYVHGYFRKNGTYVAPYTRNYPSHRR